MTLNEELAAKEGNLRENREREEELNRILKERAGVRYDTLRSDFLGKMTASQEKRQQEMNRLVELRSAYLRMYQNRNFSPTAEENREYQELLAHLNDDRLEEFRVQAASQARTAVEHFKDDFMYKIRSAIKEALSERMS